MPQMRLEILPRGLGWVDVTDDLRETEGVTIRRGRPDESSQVDPGEMSLHLNNRHGNYSPRNPNSPYFGRIGRNTPMRLAVRGQEPYLRITDVGQGARTPSGPHLDVSGDLDVRLELALNQVSGQRDSDWFISQQKLIGRYDTVSTIPSRMWRVIATDWGNLALQWSEDGVGFIGIPSTVPHTYRNGERFAIRVVLDVDNGNGQYDLRFYTAPSIEGPWDLLGNPILGDTTTTINQTGVAPLTMGDIDMQPTPPGRGRYYRCELRNGIDGPVLASADLTGEAPGSTGWTDAEGNDWELFGPEGVEITDFYQRFTGEVTSWPSRWDVSDTDVWVPVAAHGVLRRMGQGQKPLQSALFRMITSDRFYYSLLSGIPEPVPVAYWPLEDGVSSEAAASPIPGVPSMVTTNFEFAANSELAGSNPMAQIGAGALMSARVPAYNNANQAWHIEFVYKLAEAPAAYNAFLDVFTTTSPWVRYSLRVGASGVQAIATDIDGTATMLLLNAPVPAELLAGNFARFQLFSQQEGGNVRVSMRVTRVDTGASFFWSNTFAGTVGVVSQISSTFGPDLDGMALGHMSVFDRYNVSVYTFAAPGFNFGESVTARIRRLAFEEGLRLTTPGNPAQPNVTTGQMGPQRPLSLLELLHEAVEADQGILYESKETEAALTYIPTQLLTNRAPGLTLDYGNGEVTPPLDPIDDDQGVRNKIELTRLFGSSVLAEKTTGPLSTEAPPLGIGLYEEAHEVNVWRDAQLPNIAAWRLHIRTWDELRYPVVRANLVNPRMVEAQQRVLDTSDVGSTLRIINQPTWMPPGDVDLLVNAYEERINQHEWGIDFTCSPNGPWLVGQTTSEHPTETDRDRLDTDGAELYEDALADMADLVVHTPQPASELSVATWINSHGVGSLYPEDFPYLANVGGEVVRVTRTEPLAWDNFDRTEVGTWGTSSSGHVYNEDQSVNPGERSVSGGAGRVALFSLPVLRRNQIIEEPIRDCEVLTTISVDQMSTGASLLPGVLMRYVDNNNFYRTRVHFTDGGLLAMSITYAGTSVSGNVFTQIPYSPNELFHLRVRLVGHTMMAKVWPSVSPERTSEPLVWTAQATFTENTIDEGYIGTSASAFEGNTNANPEMAFRDFRIITPQLFTVERSIEGVVKSHTTGTPVSIARPAFVAL